MKKSLLIALCCITAIFAACKKEKPNEMFVGTYHGTATVSGTLAANNPLVPNQTLTQDVSDDSIETTATVTAGDADDKVVMTLRIEGQDETLTAYGTVSNNNTVVFDPVSITRNLDTINATVNATLNMTGTCGDNTLKLTGELEGSGTYPMDGLGLPIDLPFTITGSMNASLDKLLPE